MGRWIIPLSGVSLSKPHMCCRWVYLYLVLLKHDSWPLRVCCCVPAHALYAEYCGFVQACPQDDVHLLYKLFSGPHPPPRAMFPSSSIPESFLVQLIECTSMFAQYQVQVHMVIYSLSLHHMTII